VRIAGLTGNAEIGVQCPTWKFKMGVKIKAQALSHTGAYFSYVRIDEKPATQKSSFCFPFIAPPGNLKWESRSRRRL